MKQGMQERAPDGMTENKPLLGPVVFIPLLVILVLAIGLGAWLLMAGG